MTAAVETKEILESIERMVEVEELVRSTCSPGTTPASTTTQTVCPSKLLSSVISPGNDGSRNDWPIFHSLRFSTCLSVKGTSVLRTQAMCSGRGTAS